MRQPSQFSNSHFRRGYHVASKDYHMVFSTGYHLGNAVCQVPLYPWTGHFVNENTPTLNGPRSCTLSQYKILHTIIGLLLSPFLIVGMVTTLTPTTTILPLHQVTILAMLYAWYICICGRDILRKGNSAHSKHAKQSWHNIQVPSNQDRPLNIPSHPYLREHDPLLMDGKHSSPKQGEHQSGLPPNFKNTKKRRASSTASIYKAHKKLSQHRTLDTASVAASEGSLCCTSVQKVSPFACTRQLEHSTVGTLVLEGSLCCTSVQKVSPFAWTQ